MWDGDIREQRAGEQGSEVPGRRVRAAHPTAAPRPTLILPAIGGSPAATRRAASDKRKLSAAPATDPCTTPPTAMVTIHEAPGDEQPTDASRDTVVFPETRIARRATTARPVRAEDTALVERATLLLSVVDAVPANPRELVSAVTGDTEPVTIIPRTVELPAVWTPSFAPKRRKRSVRSSILIWGLACVVVLAVVSAATPLAGRVFSQPFVPSAARIAVNPSAVPSGPWSSVSGAVQSLGVGGGAGPGVKAPGTAGIPVKTPPKTTNPPKPANPPSTGISPAPVSPWPPANAYMYVPGHPAFGVQPNGYYSWAFGQCTWWAQWERRDENLTHMGNAMYWASGAAARGYRVGSTPVAGATVVLQPGVEGASGAGHVAHVVAVYPDGWFLVSEMNFYWNGGGWGRVDYRFAHTGWGVQFIY
jgi:surface antigen